jgi:hypothetical protein
MEDNRRRVDEMSGGCVAYVYMPDTFAGGFASFNRYYFSQVGGCPPRAEAAGPKRGRRPTGTASRPPGS